MEYVLVIHRESDGGYRAVVPALEGCSVEGDTLDAVLSNAPGTISSYLESLPEAGIQTLTEQGIIIATITVPGRVVGVNEGRQSQAVFSGGLDQSRVSSESDASRQGSLLARGAGAECDISAPRAARSIGGRVPEWVGVAAGVLLLWFVLVSVYPLWNAWDARNGTPSSQGVVPASAAAPRAIQTAPTAELVATVAPSYAVPPVATTATVLVATPTAVPSAAPRASQGEYVVKPGETLWSVSQRFGVTVEDVMRANDLTDRTYVRSGQRLVIPVAQR